MGVCAFSSKTSDNDDSITEQAHDKTLTSLIPVPAALITGPNGNPALEDENTHLEEKKTACEAQAAAEERALTRRAAGGVYLETAGFLYTSPQRPSLTQRRWRAMNRHARFQQIFIFVSTLRVGMC